MDEEINKESQPEDFAEGMAENSGRDKEDRKMWRQIAQRLGQKRSGGSQEQGGG